MRLHMLGGILYTDVHNIRCGTITIDMTIPYYLMLAIPQTIAKPIALYNNNMSTLLIKMPNKNHIRQ